MTHPIPGGRRRVDLVLDPAFLQGLDDLSLDDLRARRVEAEQEEADLSYLRRMLLGRLDIVEAEIMRRSSPDSGDLVSRLSEILADPNRATGGPGRPMRAEPSRVDEHRRQMEQVIADAVISDVTARSDEELAQAVRDLTSNADEVSDVRRSVQRVADELSAELARRYREGLANVDDVLAAAREAGPTGK